MSILLGDRNGPTTHKGDFQKSAHHPPNYEVTQMDNFKVYSSLNLGQIAPSVKNCLKSQIWGPPELAENLNPLHTMYTLTPSSIHTQKRTKTYIIMACIGIQNAGQKSTVNLKKQIWLPMAFNKKTPPPIKSCWSSFSNVNLPPAKTSMLFPHCLESLSHKSTPSQAILASTKEYQA